MSSHPLNTETDNAIQAAVLRQLLEHLRKHPEVQNIDLMNLADFCRNCLAKWYRSAAAEAGQELSDSEAREFVYGMPYADWKSLYQKEASATQQATFERKQVTDTTVTSGRQIEPTQAILQHRLADLLPRLNNQTADFEDVLALADQLFIYQPATFRNGEQHNTAGTNEGSCRAFALGQLAQLTGQDMLTCFGRHYRSVLATPEGNDHANIRQFMQTGWAGIHFEQFPLRERNPA